MDDANNTLKMHVSVRGCATLLISNGLAIVTFKFRRKLERDITVEQLPSVESVQDCRITVNTLYFTGRLPRGISGSISPETLNPFGPQDSNDLFPTVNLENTEVMVPWWIEFAVST